jgi:membrane peptidoglycan carboxypeptidase
MTRRIPPPPRGYTPGAVRRSSATGSASDPRRSPHSRKRPATIAALPAIILGAFAVVAAGLFIGVMAVYASYASGLPDVSSIENFQLSEGSHVVSADGVELASFAAEQRKVIPFDQIPKVMVDAQVAAEDKTFWSNPCVDIGGIVRALVQNLTAGRQVSGASTICQQLIRMRLFDASLLADPGRQVERKLKEAILALRLGEHYPGTEGKQKILEMYVNQVYYGNNAYGIWAAAHAYFGKDITKADAANKLKVGEAALLATLVRAPSTLDPTKVAVAEKLASGKTALVVPVDSAPIRFQRITIENMAAQGLITAAQARDAEAEPIVLAPTASTNYKAPHFVYAVRSAAGELLGGEDLLDREGLTITTTLDFLGYQAYAEKWAAVGYDLNRMTDAQLTAKYGKAALTWIKSLQHRNINNDALVTIDYRTGAVLAYVGSANYYGEASKAFQPNYDVAGQAYRQAGSAFKPITYATAFERGAVTPATMFMDVKGEIINGYSVPDADGRERGPVRLRDALKYSLNIPAVKTEATVGIANVVAMAERMGLHWDPQQANEVAVPSLTLGTIGTHMLDLAGAYGTLANGGVRATPYLIEKITDRNGKVVYDHASDAPKPERVISAQSAYLVTDILADNTDPSANPWWGPRFQLPAVSGKRRPATLKTGTTNDFRDLQAFGFLAPSDDPADPKGAIVTGVWVGNSDFSAIKSVFAADGPTFIWHDYMAEVAKHNSLPYREFARPDGIVEKQIDALSGQLPGDHTVHTMTEVFLASDVPTERDTTHQELGDCGQGASQAPSASAGPSGSPAPSGQPASGGKVYLDLSTWESVHPDWVTADTAWINRWRGREGSLPRFPLPALDAPLAATTKCTPAPSASPTPSPSATPLATPSPSPSPSHGPPTPTPGPTPTPQPSPSASAPAAGASGAPP